MGCSAATPLRVRPATKIISTAPTTILDFTQTMSTVDQSPQFTESFNQVTNNIQSFRSTANMMPIVCFSHDSTPIATFPIYEKGNQNTDIRLPVLALSMSHLGRIVCFSHISPMLPDFFDSLETTQLFFNILSWLTNNQKLTTKILLLEIPDKYASEIRSSAHSQSLRIKIGDFSSSFESHQVIIVSDNLDTSIDKRKERLLKFCSNGGGIICFHIPFPTEDPNEEPKFNYFLREFGIAYTPAVMGISPKIKVAVDIPQKFDDVQPYHFLSLVNGFREMTSRPDLDPALFDDLVATLRYHILVASSRQLKSLGNLSRLAITFLQKTRYTQNGVVCSTIPQFITALLVVSISNKLPAESLLAIDAYKIFPGQAYNVVTRNHSMAIKLHEDSWISTGLWLPAGNFGSIEFEKQIPGVSFQIGCHDSSLLSKMGPWKRWPSITSFFPMKPQKTDVGTSFGGFLYIVVDDCFTPSPEYNGLLSFRFTDFCMYPRAVVGKPEILEATKKFEIPWGELMTKTTIFSLPTAALVAIPNIDEFSNTFDYWVELMMKFLFFTPHRPYRVVFDIQTVSGEMEPNYPIFALIDDIPDIISACSSQPMPPFLFPETSKMSGREDSMEEPSFNEQLKTECSKDSISESTKESIISERIDSSKLTLHEEPSIKHNEEVFSSTQHILEKDNSLKNDNTNAKPEEPHTEEVTHENQKENIVIKPPNRALFDMLVMFGIVSLPNGFFDKVVERAIAMVAAAVVIKSQCPHFDINTAYANYQFPPLFKELMHFHWEINSTVIPDLLKEAQQSKSELLESQEDMWLRFVRELCQRSKVNFSNILKKVNPIPLNLLSNLAEYPCVGIK